MTMTVPEAIERGRELTVPALRATVDRLHPRLRRIVASNRDLNGAQEMRERVEVAPGVGREECRVASVHGREGGLQAHSLASVMRWLLRSQTTRTGPVDVKSSGMFGWNGL